MTRDHSIGVLLIRLLRKLIAFPGHFLRILDRSFALSEPYAANALAGGFIGVLSDLIRQLGPQLVEIWKKRRQAGSGLLEGSGSGNDKLTDRNQSPDKTASDRAVSSPTDGQFVKVPRDTDTKTTDNSDTPASAPAESAPSFCCKALLKTVDCPSLIRQWCLGFAILHPVGNAFFTNMDDKYLKLSDNHLINGLGKMAIEQTCFGPGVNCIYMISIGLLEGKKVGPIWRDICDNFFSILAGNFAFWGPVSMINFQLMPPAFRLLFSRLASIVWMVRMIGETESRGQVDNEGEAQTAK